MNIEIVEALKTYFNKHGKAPTVQDVDTQPGFPCCSDTIIRRFKGFNAALTAAGVPINRSHRLKKLSYRCKRCKKVFLSTKPRIYCARRCSNQDHINQRKCLYCGKNLPLGKGRGKFCNHLCHNEHSYNLWVKQWKIGAITGNISKSCQISACIKRYLREKFGDKCTRCDWSIKNPITGKVPLTVEHKDGNSENSVESNLDLICPNCHSLTPTYGSLNRGRGRKHRRK